MLLSCTEEGRCLYTLLIASLPILLENCKIPTHLEAPGTGDALWHTTRLFWNCAGPKERHLLTVDGVALQSRCKIDQLLMNPKYF